MRQGAVVFWEGVENGAVNKQLQRAGRYLATHSAFKTVELFFPHLKSFRVAATVGVQFLTHATGLLNFGHGNDQLKPQLFYFRGA